MTEIACEQMPAGAAQTPEPMRACSSPAALAICGGAFARVMNSVKVEQGRDRKDREDKPPAAQPALEQPCAPFIAHWLPPEICAAPAQHAGEAGAAPPDKVNRPRAPPLENPLGPAPVSITTSIQPPPYAVFPPVSNARPSDPAAPASAETDIDAKPLGFLKKQMKQEERLQGPRDLPTTEAPDRNGLIHENKLEAAAVTEPQALPNFSNEQGSLSAPASEPLPDLGGAAPKTINIIDLQTHLPTAIVNSLPQPTRETKQSEATPESQHVDLPPQEQRKGPLKILKFGMEPAALGAIEVKMRVTHSRVEIEIAAENASTSALLIDTHDALSAAIEQKGLSLHSYEVTLNAAPPTGAQRDSESRDEQRTYSEERGFANDDRPGQRRRQDAPQPDQRRSDRATADPLPVGFIL